MAQTLAVETRGLTKRYSTGVLAVNNLDLRVRAGEVYGFLGPNGAGKTTTLRLLAGVLLPDQGSARVLGREMWSATPEERAKMAYVSQLQRLHQGMTIEELCHYASHFYERWDMAYARELAGPGAGERGHHDPVGQLQPPEGERGEEGGCCGRPGAGGRA